MRVCVPTIRARNSPTCQRSDGGASDLVVADGGTQVADVRQSRAHAHRPNFRRRAWVEFRLLLVNWTSGFGLKPACRQACCCCRRRDWFGGTVDTSELNSAAPPPASSLRTRATAQGEPRRCGCHGNGWCGSTSSQHPKSSAPAGFTPL